MYLTANGMHVVFVADRSTSNIRVTFYIDGQLHYYDVNTTLKHQRLRMGIPQTKAFDVALTAAQVADLYLNPEKIVPDGVADSALKLWLPMMEGAGTTAYDGSGNGNHGTINGATWVSGIGAPVAQTALVSWNKGTNLALFSEQWNNAAAWILENASVTSNTVISPSGYQDADTLTGTDSFPRLLQSGFALADNTDYTISSFLKAGTAYSVLLIFVNKAGTSTFYRFNLQDGTAQSGASIQNYGNGWYRCSFTANSGTGATTPSVRFASNDFGTTGGWTNGLTIHAWGASITQSSSVQPYIPTLATAQTSPVLLPQGLTANKDITGVNAFESARNPYALNLDGASWGEVHDNASLDFTGSRYA
jgi:hypothetical protein